MPILKFWEVFRAATPLKVNLMLTVSVSPTFNCTGLLELAPKYVMPITAVLPMARDIEPGVVVHELALETNQAESVGRLWLLRVPSAKVSSRITVALAEATYNKVVSTTGARLRRFMRITILGHKESNPFNKNVNAKCVDLQSHRCKEP